MKLLFLTARPPWPPRRGDQARAAGLIEVLAERHQIRVLSLQGPSFKPAPPPCANVTLEVLRVPAVWVAVQAVVGGGALLLGARRPIQAALFDLPAFQRQAAEVLAEFQPDVVIVQLSRLADVLPALAGTPVLLDLIDSLALNIQRRAEHSSLLAPFWRLEAARLLAWEKAAVAKVACATVVAERDRAFLGLPAESLRVLPFGIETPAAMPFRSGPHEFELVLTGNLGYFPSVVGIHRFLREVWPLLCAALPEIKLLLAGARPASSLRRLVAATPGVELAADPPDLRAQLRRGAVAIAPLEAGSGTPIKVLEAMAEGLPVVASPAALGGLDDLPEGAVRRADTPRRFADAILELLANPAAASMQAERAFAWVVARHERRLVAEGLEAMLAEIVAAAVSPAVRPAVSPGAPPAPR